MPTPAIPVDFAQNVLGYVQVSSHLAKKALDLVSAYRQREKQAADKIPALVDHLVTIKTIKESEKEAAAKMLADPLQLQDLLKIAHERVAELQMEVVKLGGGKPAAPELGHATKVGADGDAKPGANGTYNSLTDPYVGRRTSFKKASDNELGKGYA